MGASIAFWRRLQGITQKALAKVCELPDGRVSKFETGRSWPDDEEVEALAPKLGISRETLYRTKQILHSHMSTVRGGDAPSFRRREERLEPAQLIQEASAALPEHLVYEWQDLQRDENTLRARRDELEWRTQHYFLEAAVAAGGRRE